MYLSVFLTCISVTSELEYILISLKNILIFLFFSEFSIHIFVHFSIIFADIFSQLVNYLLTLSGFIWLVVCFKVEGGETEAPAFQQEASG